MSSIKKFVLSIGAALGVALVITLSLALIAPVSSSASSPNHGYQFSANTVITGVVTNNGKPVNRAKVVVVCNNNSRNDTTNTSGSYSVQFTARQCPVGSKVTVAATKGNMGGTGSGIVDKTSKCKLKVNIINVSIPEFGLITGISAGLMGGGAFLVIRRRQSDGR